MSDGCKPIAFTGLFTLIYAAVYAPKVPVMLYYPKLGILHFGAALPASADAGPAMYWYGWVLFSLLGALLGSWFLPPRSLKRLWLALAWLGPAGQMIYVIVHEWHWFEMGAA